MIKNLLDTLLGNAEHQLDDDDEKIALAALCVRVAKSDNDYASKEISVIDAELGPVSYTHLTLPTIYSV